MHLDDELCLCFHVTKRKLLNYLRLEKPQVPTQLADCYGAGTGCGWCRPYLQKIFEDSQSRQTVTAIDSPDQDDRIPDLPSVDEYAKGRATYVRTGGGTPPPGATPIES